MNDFSLQIGPNFQSKADLTVGVSRPDEDWAAAPDTYQKSVMLSMQDMMATCLAERFVGRHAQPEERERFFHAVCKYRLDQQVTLRASTRACYMDMLILRGLVKAACHLMETDPYEIDVHSLVGCYHNHFDSDHPTTA